MKKILLALFLVVLLIMGTTAFAADTWKTANQISVAWDTPTTLVDGTPIPAGSTITYNMWVKLDGDTGPGTKVTATPIAANSGVFTFTTEGKFRVGVSAVRTDASGNTGESVVGWSNDSAVCKDGATFGVIFFVAPAGAKNLRPL